MLTVKRVVFLISLFITTLAFSQKSKFEFIYLSDGGHKDKYVSSKNLFIRNDFSYPTQAVKIKLTKKDRLEILNKIMEINFLNYPERYEYSAAEANTTPTSIIPCPDESLTVFLEGKEKSVYWDYCTGSSGKSYNGEFEKLVELSTLINKIIENKPKFKKIKQHNVVLM